MRYVTSVERIGFRRGGAGSFGRATKRYARSHRNGTVGQVRRKRATTAAGDSADQGY